MFQLDTEFPPLISSITELSHLMTVFNRWVVAVVIVMVMIVMMIVMMMSMQLCQLLHLPDQAPVQPRQSAGRDPRHGGHPHQHSPGTGSLIMQTGANWSQTSPICLIPRRVHSTPLVMKVYREIVSELLVLAGGHGYNIQRRFNF